MKILIPENIKNNNNINEELEEEENEIEDTKI